MKKPPTCLLLYVSIIDRNVEKCLEGAGWSGRKGREREGGRRRNSILRIINV
jgi:hypothetical protein